MPDPPRSRQKNKKSFWGQPASGVLDTEIIVDRVLEFLLAAQVTLGRLNRRVAEQELYLLQFPTRQVAQPGAGTTQIVRGKLLDARALQQLSQHAISPSA